MFISCMLYYYTYSYTEECSYKFTLIHASYVASYELRGVYYIYAATLDRSDVPISEYLAQKTVKAEIVMVPIGTCMHDVI